MPFTDGLDLAAQSEVLDPQPDFESCGVCGADARRYCYWDMVDGWTCTNCGGVDGGD